MPIDFINEPAAPSFDDPLGMLSACHRRIERQLGTLARLQRHLPEHGSDRDAQQAARAILKYFDNAAPNHHADEEESIFPRLIARSPLARAIVERLESDHAALAENWRQLRPMLASIAAGERETLELRLVNKVQQAYDSHIAVEETELIPLARDVLGDAELVTVGREMAKRRGVDPSAPWRPDR